MSHSVPASLSGSLLPPSSTGYVYTFGSDFSVGQLNSCHYPALMADLSQSEHAQHRMNHRIITQPRVHSLAFLKFISPTLYITRPGLIYSIESDLSSPSVSCPAWLTKAVQTLNRMQLPLVDGVIRFTRASKAADNGSSAAPNGFALFLTSDGRVLSVGENGCGQLGLGHNRMINEITFLRKFEPPRDAAAHRASQGKSVDEEKSGEFVDRFTAEDSLSRKFDAAEMARSPMQKRIVQLVAGASHTLFLTDSGEVYCCGSNQRGQLGVGKSVSSLLATSPIFQRFLAHEKIIQIQAFGNASAAVSESGKLFVWGSGILKRDIETPMEFSLPGQRIHSLQEAAAASAQQADDQQRIVQVAIGDAHLLALSASGAIYSLGYSPFGALGLGSAVLKTSRLTRIIAFEGLEIDPSDPDALESLPLIRRIACGPHYSVLISVSGQVFTFGNTENDKLGHFLPNINAVYQPKLLETTAQYRVSHCYAGSNRLSLFYPTELHVSSQLTLDFRGQTRLKLIGQGFFHHPIHSEIPIQVEFTLSPAYGSGKLAVPGVYSVENDWIEVSTPDFEPLVRKWRSKQKNKGKNSIQSESISLEDEMARHQVLVRVSLFGDEYYSNSLALFAFRSPPPSTVFAQSNSATALVPLQVQSPQYLSNPIRLLLLAQNTNFLPDYTVDDGDSESASQASGAASRSDSLDSAFNWQLNQFHGPYSGGSHLKLYGNYSRIPYENVRIRFRFLPLYPAAQTPGQPQTDYPVLEVSATYNPAENCMEFTSPALSAPLQPPPKLPKYFPSDSSHSNHPLTSTNRRNSIQAFVPNANPHTLAIAQIEIALDSQQFKRIPCQFAYTKLEILKFLHDSQRISMAGGNVYLQTFGVHFYKELEGDAVDAAAPEEKEEEKRDASRQLLIQLVSAADPSRSLVVPAEFTSHSPLLPHDNSDSLVSGARDGQESNSAESRIQSAIEKYRQSGVSAADNEDEAAPSSSPDSQYHTAPTAYYAPESIEFESHIQQYLHPIDRHSRGFLRAKLPSLLAFGPGPVEIRIAQNGVDFASTGHYLSIEPPKPLILIPQSGPLGGRTKVALYGQYFFYQRGIQVKIEQPQLEIAGSPNIAVAEEPRGKSSQGKREKSSGDSGAAASKPPKSTKHSESKEKEKAEVKVETLKIAQSTDIVPCQYIVNSANEVYLAFDTPAFHGILNQRNADASVNPANPQLSIGNLHWPSQVPADIGVSFDASQFPFISAPAPFIYYENPVVFEIATNPNANKDPAMLPGPGAASASNSASAASGSSLNPKNDPFIYSSVPQTPLLVHLIGGSEILLAGKNFFDSKEIRVKLTLVDAAAEEDGTAAGSTGRAKSAKTPMNAAASAQLQSTANSAIVEVSGQFIEDPELNPFLRNRKKGKTPRKSGMSGGASEDWMEEIEGNPGVISFVCPGAMNFAAVSASINSGAVPLIPSVSAAAPNAAAGAPPLGSPSGPSVSLSPELDLAHYVGRLMDIEVSMNGQQFVPTGFRLKFDKDPSIGKDAKSKSSTKAKKPAA